MKAALALSFAPSYDRARRDAMVRRAGATIKHFTGADARVVVDDDGALVVADLAADDVVDDATGRVTVLCSRAAAKTDGSALFPPDLLARGPDCSDIAPPFAAILRTRPGAPVVGVTDTCGLRHVSYWQGDGFAAVASSALVIAATARIPIDETALGTWALCGFLFLDQTMWRGVHRLAAAERASLLGGRVTVERPAAAVFPTPFRTREEAVSAGVGVLQDVVGGMVDAHPDCTLELSAGLDSRTILAAVAPNRRKGLLAFTLSTPNSVDEAVAAEIATREGLEHQVVTREALFASSPDELAQRARDAAIRRDCYANPLAMAALDYAEAQLPQAPRFTGQDAEYAQGRYYPGLPGRALERLPTTGRFATSQLDLVAKVRFFTNHRIDTALFRPGFLDDTQRTLRDDVHRVGGAQSNLARATEALYLQIRMRGWVSAEYGTSSLHRHVLAPFFHPAYVEWARACRPQHKQGAAVFAEMLTRLDPDLAAVPVNAGLTAFELARTDAAMRARRTGRGLQRTSRKVRQRLGRREKAPVSAMDMAPAVASSWSSTRALDALAGIDVLDQRVLEDLSSGRRTSTSGTVALLVNVLSAAEFAAAVPDA